MIAPAWYLITLQTPNFIIDNFDGGTENFMIGCFYSILLGTLFLAIRWFSVRSKNWDTPIDSSLNGLDTVFRYRNSKFNALSNDDALGLMRDTQSLDAAMNGSRHPETENIYRYMGSRLNGMSNEDGLNFLKGK